MASKDTDFSEQRKTNKYSKLNISDYRTKTLNKW